MGKKKYEIKKDKIIKNDNKKYKRIKRINILINLNFRKHIYKEYYFYCLKINFILGNFF